MHPYPMLTGAFFILLVEPVWSFQFFLNPSSPVGVNQTFDLSWTYVEGETPDNTFAVEVQGEDGFLLWYGFYNSSGSTLVDGLPFVGLYTIAAYSNTPTTENGTFFTTMVTVQDQSVPTTAPLSPTPSSTLTVSRASSSTQSTSSSTAQSPTLTSTTSGSSSSSSMQSPTTSESASSLPLSITSSSLTVSSVTPSLSSFPEVPPSQSVSDPLSSPSSPSTSSKPNTDTIIGVSIGVGLLILFISLGLYCYFRRRRRGHAAGKQKSVTIPYYYTAHTPRSHAGIPPTSSSSDSHDYKRIPPSKGSGSSSSTSHLDRAVPLNSNARDMREIFNAARPPSYREHEILEG
ncbi:hypothetical protein FB446DRAFT_793429 [Lentinula raphanica]|nr:hypothetical protein FB446DRAFT_793429 [Lentinula raphanica]